MNEISTQKISWQIFLGLAILLIFNARTGAIEPTRITANAVPIVTLLGVSNTDETSWWGEDGKPISALKLGDDVLSHATSTPAKGEQITHFYFEVKGMPKGQNDTVKIDNVNRISTRDIEHSNGIRLYAVQVVFRNDLKSCTIDVGTNITPWRDVAERETGFQYETSTATNGHLSSTDGNKNIDVLFSEISQFHSGVGLTVTNSKTDQELRVVGFNSQGKIIIPQNRGEMEIDEIQQRTVVFPSDIATDIKHIKLQARPRTWHEFKDIPLQPKN